MLAAYDQSNKIDPIGVVRPVSAVLLLLPDRP
jgi:hypothetical protein